MTNSLRRSVPNLLESQKSPIKSSNYKNQLAMSNNDLNKVKRHQQRSSSNNNRLRQSTPSLSPSDSQKYPRQPINLYQKCSYCNNEIGQNSAMIIETLNLAFHLGCFRCSVCSIPLSNGKEGTDVRVRGNRLHCNNCFSNDRGKPFFLTRQFAN